MAITLLGTPASAAATSVNYTLPAGSNRIVIGIACFEQSGVTVDSATFGGQAMTAPFATVYLDGGGTRNGLRIFYILDADLPADGARSFAPSFSSAPGDSLLTVIGIEGAKQQAPEATGTATATSTTLISKAVTSLTNGAWFISGATGNLTGITWTHGSGQTERSDFTSASATACSSTEEVSTAGSETTSHTASSSLGRLVQGVVVFAQATGQGQVIWL